MKCQSCQKNDASVCVVQEINGTKSEIYLCTSCAAAAASMVYGIQMNIGNFFQSFFNDQKPGTNLQNKVNEENKVIKCEYCGLTSKQFLNTGRIGCANCYDSFKDIIEPIIKRIHGQTTHQGKAPSKSACEFDTTRRIDKLKELLKEAVESEEYEKAANLRDRIKEIEAENLSREG